jgi:hypothetical protein
MITTGDPSGVSRRDPDDTTTGGSLRSGRLVLIAALLSAVAHGCHAGDHGDADLLVRLVTAWGSSPAAAAR